MKSSMKIRIKNIMLASAVTSMAFMQSCSLDEVNPGGYTLENLATSEEGYETLLNNCYFGLERYFYGTSGTSDAVLGYMSFLEADTDLWTYKANLSGSYDYLFKFYAGASPNTTYTNNIWNGAYDGIGACNLAIRTGNSTSFSSEATHRQKIAEARFLRAVYYYNIVEMFGGVVKLTENDTEISYTPERTEPMEIYRDIIIPDLEYAAENLSVGTDATLGTPTKKAALGFLAKACLQTYQYSTTEYLQEALDSAKKLIADCEAGGSTYNTYMYPEYSDVFAEKNNMANREALWKNALYAGSDNYGSSNGNYRLNRNHEYFLCSLSRFGARIDNQASRTSWEDGYEGTYMPTQYLLSLFVQSDGSLDPRFHKIFNTEWKANQAYTWNDGDVNNYDKASSMVGQSIEVGDRAIKFVMPQDDDYAAEVAAKATSNYLLIDYEDVYNDASKSIIMTKGSGENMFRYFYPSLNKHNSSNFYVANAGKMRNGNLNAFFIMRMAEVYLIAAEADIYLNGGSNAMTYINKVRTRAGAKALTGTATVRTVLDERGRELCGEYSRFFDLKRTGMFKDASYLQQTHPEIAQYFKPEYALRPISTTYTATITNGDTFQNPGY
jgi:hypothetical protein